MFSYLLDYLGVLVIGELVNDIYLGIYSKMFGIALLRNFVLLYGLYKGYILNKIHKLKTKFNTGVEVVNNKVIVTYPHNNRICKAELYLSKFSSNFNGCITYVDYIKDNEGLEKDVDVILYNNDLLKNSIKNLNYSPRMLGYKGVVVYYLNDNFEEEKKKYEENEIIN